MFSLPAHLEMGSLELKWQDAGAEWCATLIWYPHRPMRECEIQVDGGDAPPERVLCVGLPEGRFQALTRAELELVRRAARARSGIVWVDPRDGQLWWVQERFRDPSRLTPVYTNGRWRGLPRSWVEVPIAYLAGADHERLLDEARRLA